MNELRKRLIAAENNPASFNKQELSDLLVAAGHPSLGRGDFVDEIRISETSDLEVYVSWTAMSCNQCDDYRIPASVIDAEKPLKQAKIWNVNNKIQRAEARKRAAEREINMATSHLAALQVELFEALKDASIV